MYKADLVTRLLDDADAFDNSGSSVASEFARYVRLVALAVGSLND